MARHATTNPRSSVPGTTVNVVKRPSAWRRRSNSKPGHSVDPASKTTGSAALTAPVCWYTVSRICPTAEISSRLSIGWRGGNSSPAAPPSRQAAGQHQPGHKTDATMTQTHTAVCDRRRRAEGRTTTDTAIDMTERQWVMQKGKKLEAPAAKAGQFRCPRTRAPNQRSPCSTRAGAKKFKLFRTRGYRWCRRSRTSSSPHTRSSSAAPRWRRSPDRRPGPG
ncbi:hypothetical protein SAMN02982985_01979 [Rugamonas rubra]|uniref:Uncharacterized protein n=1 Tax=Rugamonas rubra TaxID=758825 RepID=A0A1I4LIP6_9BURK|nr:hypothetical protein SAMN02982985_01979 [Rugamonas rubra]